MVYFKKINALWRYIAPESVLCTASTTIAWIVAIEGNSWVAMRQV
jgi:hypothetical protein